MEKLSFLIIFVLLSALLFFVYPITGYIQMRKLRKNVNMSKYNKKSWYLESIIWAWIPVVIILFLFPLANINTQDLGLKWINLKNSVLPHWVVISSVILYVVYLIYNVYSIIILRTNKKARKKVADSFDKDYKLYFPASKQERKYWFFLATTAGITEEIIYRGYLFFALAFVFPDISIVAILLISTLLFGLGHIYQGTEAIKPTLIGLLFGVFYLAFGSILPIIVVHAIQDLVVIDILNSDSNENV